MAFPENVSKINTNLSLFELGLVVGAIKKEKVYWGESSLFERSRIAHFTYNNDRFQLHEWCEEIDQITRISEQTIPGFPNRFPYNELLFTGKLSAKTRNWFWKHKGLTLLHTSTRVEKGVVEAYSLNPKDFPRGAIVGVGELVPVRLVTVEERKQIEKEFGNGKMIEVFAGAFLYKFENLKRFAEPVPYKPRKGAVSVFKIPTFVVFEALKKIGISI